MYPVSVLTDLVQSAAILVITFGLGRRILQIQRRIDEIQKDQIRDYRRRIVASSADDLHAHWDRLEAQARDSS